MGLLGFGFRRLEVFFTYVPIAAHQQRQAPEQRRDGRATDCCKSKKQEASLAADRSQSKSAYSS